MEQLRFFADTYLSTLHIPKKETIQYSDVLEILILSFLIYQILVWIKNTKAWNLLKILKSELSNKSTSPYSFTLIRKIPLLKFKFSIFFPSKKGTPR